MPDPGPGESPTFLFATCQVGAEGALKAELARAFPELRLAFSRPGFLTFKLSAAVNAAPIELTSAFARAWGIGAGRLAGDSPADLAAQFCRAVGVYQPQALHVWERDTHTPGFRGFEPGISLAATEAEAAIRAAWSSITAAEAPPRIAQPGQRVVDCVLVDQGVWWAGWHWAKAGPGCLPGGFYEVQPPAELISRAWLKTEEALRWSGLPVRAGQRVVELGCAPGGSSQALLDRGLRVIGVDPAEVDPRLAAHPNFTHLRKRAAEVRRRELRNVPWLVADMNVAPAFTLDAVEALVTHPTVDVRGMLLTLKLLDWNLADHLDEYLDRVRGWGYRRVQARQLAHNRQEVCVAAQRQAVRS